MRCSGLHQPSILREAVCIAPYANPIVPPRSSTGRASHGALEYFAGNPMTPTHPRRIATVALTATFLMHHSMAVGQTPEQEKIWEAQRAQALADEKVKADLLARQRAARRADPMSWVRTLDPMSPGGWVFRAVGADGSWATFSTDHQLKRSGRLVTAWLRQEFPEPQRSAAGEVYSSDVEKVQYDCGKAQARVMLIIFYSENNLA